MRTLRGMRKWFVVMVGAVTCVWACSSELDAGPEPLGDVDSGVDVIPAPTADAEPTVCDPPTPSQAPATAFCTIADTSCPSCAQGPSGAVLYACDGTGQPTARLADGSSKRLEGCTLVRTESDESATYCCPASCIEHDDAWRDAVPWLDAGADAEPDAYGAWPGDTFPSCTPEHERSVLCPPGLEMPTGDAGSCHRVGDVTTPAAAYCCGI